MPGIYLATPVRESSSLVSSPGTHSKGLVHRNVTLVTIGKGEGHRCLEWSILIDPEFVLAEHLVGHCREAPFPLEHHGTGIKTAARRFFPSLKELLDLAELLHPARVLLFEIHHFREKLSVRKWSRRKNSGRGLDRESGSLDPFTALDGPEGGFSKATACCLGFLMSGSQGKAVDVSPAALPEHGNDFVAKRLPDPFSSGPRKVCAGEFAGVRNNDWVGGMFKEDGEGFPCSGAVRDEDVDPWNGRTIPVDAHEDMTIVGFDQTPVETDLHIRPSSPETNRFSLSPGPGYHLDDAIKGAIVPPGFFVVGDGRAAPGSEGR